MTERSAGMAADIAHRVEPCLDLQRDGQRLNGQQEKRMMLNERLMNMYRYHGFGEKLVEVDGDYSQRLTRAIELVDHLMGGAQP